LLTAFIGIPLLAAVLFFFEYFQNQAWLIVWITVIVFQLIMMYIAPWVILPLFNKFQPIQDEELKKKISDLLIKNKIRFQGIYQSDNSKRSKKGNAYFIGFGSSKRIVIYDTLLSNHSHEEIIAVLSHELGHYKHNHVFFSMILSIIEMGISLFILNQFIFYKPLHTAFGMERVTVYGGLVFFGFLYSPIDSLVSILFLAFSRKNEYQADEEVEKLTGLKEDFIKALKKLSQDNYSNLTPHPLTVFFRYSHPPVLERIKRLQGR